MADIFISYSSKDREKAEQLTELLASAGLSVWIDKQGIDVATSWSGEIVDAIEGCKAFVVLLSPHSVESVNVVKEVSLAAEQKKKILPLDLEPVELPRDLKYHLAGIQRSPMTNIDTIIRTIAKLGLEATKAPELKVVKESAGKKSLMILPFQDLSPTGDNGWFADGIVSELISALSNVKALNVVDAQTTRDFKRYQGTLPTYAHEMAIRYFVEGDVRKFGDQIKITARLLDIESGDHLWQDSIKGTMDDIFDIQEKVAEKVVEGMKLHLSQDEKTQVAKKPTSNAEAYEAWLKGLEYGVRASKEENEKALALYQYAIGLDPEFADAYRSIANVYQEIFRLWDRNTIYLEWAAQAIEKAKELAGETPAYYSGMSGIAFYRGAITQAVELARRAVELDPKHGAGYTALGFAYNALGNKAEAIKAHRENARLSENILNSQFNYLIALHEAGDPQLLRTEVQTAIPKFERHIRLNPDDLDARVTLATVLAFSGDQEKALRASDEIVEREALGGYSLYNLACIYVNCNNQERAIEILRRSLAKGFSNIDVFRSDPDLEPLRGTPEFEELVKELEAKIAKESQKSKEQSKNLG